MAISIDHVSLIHNLRLNDLIGGSKSNSILEIGQQNWFGDVDPNTLFEVEPFSDEIYREQRSKIRTLWSEKSDDYLFDIALYFYQIAFEMEEYRAFDLHGTEIAEPIDLNYALETDRQYDVVTNFGTSEHVFNQANVFETIHNFTKPSGLMLHILPNQGQYNHGFYNYHPTFFHDLVYANDYELIALAVSKPVEGSKSFAYNIVERSIYQNLINQKILPRQSGIVCVSRKANHNQSFQIPRQGVYGDQRVQLQKDWQETSMN